MLHSEAAPNLSLGKSRLLNLTSPVWDDLASSIGKESMSNGDSSTSSLQYWVSLYWVSPSSSSSSLPALTLNNRLVAENACSFQYALKAECPQMTYLSFLKWFLIKHLRYAMDALVRLWTECDIKSYAQLVSIWNEKTPNLSTSQSQLKPELYLNSNLNMKETSN